MPVVAIIRQVQSFSRRLGVTSCRVVTGIQLATMLENTATQTILVLGGRPLEQLSRVES